MTYPPFSVPMPDVLDFGVMTHEEKSAAFETAKDGQNVKVRRSEQRVHDRNECLGILHIWGDL